ncbi:MAG: glycosyltransferase [Candidatus Peribacteria bacterium]|jgi:glycosyltransferase involved in cell wall biosynthesis|nr:glycosyltransferase [Candidatus Peribacteria bacterium]
METQKYYSEYPLVSVLIPTYNGERYISEALLSVLQQTYPNIEIVVSDDASKDYTIDVVQTFQDKEDIPHPIKLITNQTNQGIAKNMNRGLEECNGKYIAILDQDDYWIDNSKLTQQIEFLEENPEYGIVGTQRDILRANQRTSSLLPTTDQQIRAFIPKFCPFQHSAVCYHKALGQEVQGYNARYHCTMDTDFFYKLLQKSQ